MHRSISLLLAGALLFSLPGCNAAKKNTAALPSAVAAPSGIDDTARIVYVAMPRRHAQIFSVQPDGRRSIQLTSESGYKCRPVWSPDHRQLVFFRYPHAQPVGDYVDLVRMQANGSGQKTVVPHLKIDPQNTRPSWSPDGTTIYMQEKDFPTILFGYSLETGRQVQTLRVPPKSFITWAQSLSPDLHCLAGTGLNATGVTHVGLVDLPQGEEVDLMEPITGRFDHTGTVAWSYDCRWVAFELDEVIVVAPTPGAPAKNFYTLAPAEIQTRYSAPAFSPSGKRMACILETSQVVVGSGDKEVRSGSFGSWTFKAKRRSA